MSNNLIISIGRQFGSGGRLVGKALAEALGFDYYDNELLSLAAKEYGMDPEFFKMVDEKSDKSLFLQRFEEYFSGGFWANNGLTNDRLFQMQSDTIRRLAEEKSFVIVGRCSDYVLRDNPNCVSIFLHSTDKDRVARLRERMPESESSSDEKII